MYAELLPDESVQALFELYLTSQGCVLLLVLKQHLKDMYGFTDRYEGSINTIALLLFHQQDRRHLSVILTLFVLVL